MPRSIFLFLFVALLSACGDNATSPAPAAAPTETLEKFEPMTYDSEASDNSYRPAYHFTPPAGWMNDPNGLVYHAGEYHLFYQYYPEENKWGPMHWGHAVSTDLLRWQHLPIALSPDEKGYIFSGSAVLDFNNTSGFGTNNDPPLVAIFTYHDMAAEKAGKTDYESQALAYSNDKGRTWIKYAGNPVLPNRGVKDFRDPKVIWDADRSQWVMVLAAQDRVQFFGSKNLKEWTYLSEFGASAPNHAGVWECPELFPLTIMESQEDAWVLTVSINPGGANGGSGTMYFTGWWDGTEFTPRREAASSPGDTVKWVDYGRDNYAGVTFDNLTDGRRVLLGWMSNWQYAQDVPTTSWRSAMTIPRDLSLHATDFGTRLHQRPVEELQKLRGKHLPLDFPRIQDGVTTIDLSKIAPDGAFELDLTLDLVDSDAEQFYLTLQTEDGEHFYRFGYDRSRGVENAFFTDRRQAGKTDFGKNFAPGLAVAPRFSNDGNLRIHALFDRTSAEVFLDGGDPVLTDIFFPEQPFTLLILESYGSAGEGMLPGWSLVKGDLWGLKP